jgi:hypothetical protein
MWAGVFYIVGGAADASLAARMWSARPRTGEATASGGGGGGAHDGGREARVWEGTPCSGSWHTRESGVEYFIWVAVLGSGAPGSSTLLHNALHPRHLVWWHTHLTQHLFSLV